MNTTEPAAQFVCQTCFVSFPSEAHLEIHIDAFHRLISFLMERVHKAASHLIPVKVEEPDDSEPPQPDVVQMCPLPACRVVKPLSQMKWHFTEHTSCFDPCPGCGVTFTNVDSFFSHVNKCVQIGADPAKVEHTMRKRRALLHRATINLQHATEHSNTKAAERGQDGSAEPRAQNHPWRNPFQNDQQSHSMQPNTFPSQKHQSIDEYMNEPMDKSQPKHFKEAQEATAQLFPLNHLQQNAFSNDLQSHGFSSNVFSSNVFSSHASSSAASSSAAFASAAFPPQRHNKGSMVYSSLSETAALDRAIGLTDTPQPQPDSMPSHALMPPPRSMLEPVPESASMEPMLPPQPPPPAEDHQMPPSAMMPPFMESESLWDAFPPEPQN